MTVNHFRKRSVIFLMNNKLHSIQINKCPFCGGTEFVYGYQSGYGAVTDNESLMSWQVLRHVICRNCGSVVHSYVDAPEKLLKWSNRR